MKKENVIEFKGMISQAVADERITRSCAVEIMNKLDEILALPLEVPSDKEIEEQFPLIDYGFCTDIERVNIGYINSKRVNIQFGMKRMRDEIIKRNK